MSSARRPPCVYRIGIAAPLYFRHESSLEHETGAHPEGPGRIPAIERELAARDWLGYERREAPEVDLKVLRGVHPATYIDEVNSTGSSRLLDAKLTATYYNAHTTTIAYDFVKTPNGAERHFEITKLVTIHDE